MAALIGKLHGARGEVSRLGTKKSGIEAKLQTWHGYVRITLDADGSYTFAAGDLNGCEQVAYVNGKVPA